MPPPKLVRSFPAGLNSRTGIMASVPIKLGSALMSAKGCGNLRCTSAATGQLQEDSMSRVLVLMVALLATAFGSSARVQSYIDAITSALQNAIDSVDQQSDAWRETLPKLITQLNDIEAKASGDIKITASDIINQVS